MNEKQVSLIQIKPERGELADVAPLNMQHLFEMAINSPGGAETLARLQEIYHKEQDRNAALEFNQALTKFQDDCPPIERNTHINFATKDGRRVDYRSADFEQIVETTRPHLRANGFSFAFDTETNGAMVTVTCTLRHVNGHSVASKATIPSESTNPGMSPQQKVGSAITFAKRMTLTSVLGLSLTDPEEEGGDPTPITKDQENELDDLLRRSNTDYKRFIKWATGREDAKYSDIRATKFQEAKLLLQDKLRNKK